MDCHKAIKTCETNVNKYETNHHDKMPDIDFAFCVGLNVGKKDHAHCLAQVRTEVLKDRDEREHHKPADYK